MVIDFHSHVFPEAIAEKALSHIEETDECHRVTNGTMKDFQENIQNSGVNLSILLPVATSPKQFETINKVALGYNEKYDNVLSFGGAHPLSNHWKEELKEIKSMGFKGIKMHPDCQDTPLDSEESIRFIDYAAQLGLVNVIHTGFDPNYHGSTNCDPRAIRNLLDALGEDIPNLVLAHLGGLDFHPEDIDLICDSKVYFDIACYNFIPIKDDLIQKIVKRHGADKIVFGSDCPWSDPKSDIERILTYDLSDEEKDKIFYKNALKLLKMKEEDIKVKSYAF
ncbi:hypothetical protein SAMN05216249_11335 [Acetitomaculum ruminis DSM 5522]|uniref:Amidohydrolase-related domain-containing protein n=1 Tax=Acetitomaculum ruminis DSM 5522 TaxID=1120918 RepID=A0A1I0Z563_9FIRM|nr:amidohydrolase family protein [Acetitomaculum ruminis]SFB20879.1 hypothetical protein SAMN05216249_11335 [Acetitomaculum ruminis DSM 5522]